MPSFMLIDSRHPIISMTLIISAEDRLNLNAIESLITNKADEVCPLCA
jgi:hypothetical protein